jgi:hypothetical protein
MKQETSKTFMNFITISYPSLELLPQGLKPENICGVYGTAEAVPLTIRAPFKKNKQLQVQQHKQIPFGNDKQEEQVQRQRQMQIPAG